MSLRSGEFLAMERQGCMDVMSIEASAEPEADLLAFSELTEAAPGAVIDAF